MPQPIQEEEEEEEVVVGVTVPLQAATADPAS